MAAAHTGHPVQLIGGSGHFNKSAIGNITTQSTKLQKCGQSYGVIAIIGPQSSGKSTLLNHLFKTEFKEMNTSQGRKQTTIGIWISTADTENPAIVLLDTEGSDGRERGDETLFERQCALFALATADVILMNLWYNDVGRVKGSGFDMFRTVLQAMVKLFNSSKRTILFVIRDQDPEANLHDIENILRADIQKIWEEESANGSFSGRGVREMNDLLDIQITGLTSPEYEKEKFLDQVLGLKSKLCGLIDGRGHTDKIPATGLSCIMYLIWEQIKTNCDLDLPTLKAEFAKSQCEQLAKDSVNQFKNDKDWLRLKEDAKMAQMSTGFCEKVWMIIEKIASSYDEECMHYDEQIQKAEKTRMMSNLLKISYPVYEETLAQIFMKCSKEFKTSMGKLQPQNLAENGFKLKTECLAKFEKECAGPNITQYDNGWSATTWRTSTGRETLLSKFMESVKENIYTALSGPVRSILRHGSFGKSWTQIRAKLHDQYSMAKEEILRDLLMSDIKLEPSRYGSMIQDVHSYARGVVERIAREETQTDRIIQNMNDRFIEAFNYDEDNSPRDWKTVQTTEDCKTIFGKASFQFHGVLCALVAMRLDVEDEAATDRALAKAFENLMNSSQSTADWIGLPPTCTVLISPADCKSIWIKATERINDIYIRPVQEIRDKMSQQQTSEKKEEERRLKSKSLESRIMLVFHVATELAIGSTLIAVGNHAGVIFLATGLARVLSGSSTTLQKAQPLRLQSRNQNEVPLLTASGTNLMLTGPVRQALLEGEVAETMLKGAVAETLQTAAASSVTLEENDS